MSDEKRHYAVWSEGYIATGNEACAHYEGCALADSFQEACDIVCKDVSHYDSKTRSVWGCNFSRVRVPFRNWKRYRDTQYRIKP